MNLWKANVSQFALGSMTFGTQTPQDIAHRQIDLALEAGVNLIDTAEMYPVNPFRAETTGLSEIVIGNWVASHPAKRAKMMICTKHAGSRHRLVRGGEPISSKTIPQAVEGSLKRLQTDFIDLYLFHWPNRGSYSFRNNWIYDPFDQDPSQTLAHFDDALAALSKQVDKGNIREFGLSNETIWGMGRWCARATATGGPRPVAIQNEYSLLCRLADTDLAEFCVHEDVGIMAYSPLAGGLLTGKYRDGQHIPDRSRMTYTPDIHGRVTHRMWPAVAAYGEIALKHGLDLTQMALAWAAAMPFVATVTLGAVDEAQLRHALQAQKITLSDTFFQDIDIGHRAHPMPF